MLEKIKRTLGFILSHNLAKRNKLRALRKFLIWQVQTTISPSTFYRKKFASKLWVSVNKGQTGMTGNLYAGLHEFEDMAFLLHFLRPDDVFIDAGANVGSYSLLASGIVGSQSIAFEPLPTTFNNLINNINLNGLSNLVMAHNIGLSSGNGFLKFSADYDTTNHVLQAESDNNSIEVPVSTLDNQVDPLSNSLLKIDVEGYETEVLKGGKTLLSSPNLKAIIIELNGSGNRYGFDDRLIHQDLVNTGFSPACYDPFSRVLKIQESYGDKNTIYVKDIDFINKRIESSKKYKIFGVEF